MTTERIAINIRVDKLVATAFKKLAKKEKRSVSAMVGLVMEEELQRRKI